MDRRRSVVTLCALCGLFALRQVVAQQGRKVWRIGWLSLASANAYKEQYDAFRSGLRVLGYVEGRDFVMEPRWADGRRERVRVLAAELVGAKIDVLVVSGTSVVAIAKEATKTIPIVMVAVADPVGNKLVASLARPGGNITGQANMNIDTAPKLLELAREIVPKVSRIAVLMSDDPTHLRQLNDLRKASDAARLTVVPVKAMDPREMEGAFAAMEKERVDVLIVLPGIDFNIQNKRIVDLAASKKLPAVCPRLEYVESGGLISYGPSLLRMYQHAGTYVDKILKGAKAGELPIEQPTTLELAVNLKTAKALGIKVPPSILFRADRVIE